MIKYLLLSVLGGLILAAPSFVIGLLVGSPVLMVVALALLWLPASALVWVLVAYREDFDAELHNLLDQEK
jgi:hypothetical protein